MSVIRTENLGKTYKGGTLALRGLDLEVGSGEVFGFLGPNGAGKSTAIQLLLNFIRPTTGSARLFGIPASSEQARQRVGYLPETVSLHGYYSGQALLEFYAGLHGIERDRRARRSAELLERVGLADAAGRKVSQYSKGMQQRLGLAQALVNDPDLLILDEPTSNLDPVGRQDFRDIVLEFRARGKTVLICSHILSEVESVCDRVAILQQGVLKRAGTLKELSGPSGARVIVKHLPAQAVEAIPASGARLTLSAGEAVVACDSHDVLRDVERILGECGAVIERVEAEARSLEDIFFAAIDREDAQ